MDSLLKDLTGFYSKLDELLQPSNRDCGVCGQCCKAASMLRVHPLELENIRRAVQNELLFNRFQDFANNNVIRIWGNTAGNCPFQDGALCGIYPVRPYYCRIYGHYDHRGKSLLDGCVYRGHAINYSRREELPLVDRFDRLADAYAKLVGESQKPTVRRPDKVNNQS